MPPHGVPFVGDRPAFQMQSAGEGRVFLSNNRTMTMTRGMKIALMLSEEGEEGTGPQAN